MKLQSIIVAGLGMMLCCSCSNHKGWGIKGNIADAAQGTKMAIEANNAGHWYLIDSLEVASNGDFEYNAEAPYSGQDILRLTIPGKGSVYFPIDSVDHVALSASANNFGTGHKLSGTYIAERVGHIDSIVANTADADDLRRQLINIITTDTTGIVAYYTLGKSLAGKALFDPNDNLGNRAYGAVAQLYSMYRPQDPRGQVVNKAYFEGRRALGKLPEEFQPIIEVPETSFFEIERYDSRGQKQSLTELAKGKTVVLNFTTFEHPNSPTVNSILNEVYTKHHSKGLEIYQIAFDANEVTWREAARNLPWVSVWNAPSDGNTVLVNYNVGVLPLFYIIDNKGDLIERIEDPSELSSKVAKYL